MATQVRTIKTRMNAGELSPLLDSRTDIPQYSGGCRSLKNFVPRVHGSIYKRPGQQYLGRTKRNGDEDSITCLKPFNYDTDTKFQFAFSDRCVRFWNGTTGEFITVDVSEIAPWTSTTTGGPDFYSVGSLIWSGTNHRIYGAKLVNTPAVENEPPSSVWSPSPAKRWAASTAYFKGDIVATSAADSFKANWLVINDHTASSTPDVDTTNYAPLWHLGTVTDPGVYDYNWKTAEPYVLGEKIVVQSTTGAGANLKTILKSYKCISAHTSGSTTKPGSGASWATKWVETTVPVAHSTASVSYYVGDLVKVGTSLYISTTAHTSSAANEPTDSGSPWVLVANTVPWLTTSTQRDIGDWLMVGSIFVFSLQRRKTSATITISLGSNVYFKKPDMDVDEWAAKDAYDLGDIVENDGITYVAIQDHPKDAAKEPGSDGGIEFWQKLANVESWKAAQSYGVGQYVVSGGTTYRCIQEHISGYSPSVSTPREIIVDSIYGYDSGFAVWDGLPLDFTVNDMIRFPLLEENDLFEQNTIYYVTEVGQFGGAGRYWFKFAYTLGGPSIDFSSEVTGGRFGDPLLNTVQKVFPDSGGDYLGVFADDLALGYWVADNYILELETEYTEDQIFDLKTFQVNDIVWIVHPLHRPKWISRYADSVWRLADVPWSFPPMRDENIEEDLTLTPSGVTGNITLTGAGRIFFPGMEGGYFSVAHRRNNAFTKLALSAVAASTSVKLKGNCGIFVYGATWKGELVLEISKDNSSWRPLRNWTQPVANMRTITATVTFDEPTYVRFNMTVHDAGGASDYAIIEAADSRITGLVKITAVNSSSSADATVIKELGGTGATDLWAEGAFSTYRGFPSCITMHELRIGLAGNAAEPHLVRLSSIDGFEDFQPGALDTSPFSFEMASADSNAIRWIESVNDALGIGTVGEEWVATSGSEGKIITPLNPPRVRRQSRRGSSRLGAFIVGDTLMFIQTNRLVVREFSHDAADSKWISQDMTQLAEHITASGIKQVAVARQPDTIMYCVTNDGRLITMTYDRVQQVVAWAQHETDGLYESVSTIYGSENQADQVWFVVKRTINGVERRMLERFHQQTSLYDFTSDALLLCYLDCAVVKTQSASTVVSDLEYMEGEDVTVLADGVVRGPFTVEGGQITLPTAAGKVVVGLPFTAFYQGMKAEIEDQQGTNQGKKWKLDKVAVKLYQSNGMEATSNPDDATLSWRAKEMGNTSDISSRVVLPKEFLWSIEGRATEYTNFSLRSSTPLPTNIVSIIYVLSTSGN